MMRSWRIFCGMHRQNGPPVTRLELQDFLRRQVRSRFGSFSVQRTNGFWKAVPEPSAVIEIVDDSPAAEARVRAIAAAYKRRFEQQAVMVVTSEVDVAQV